MSLKVFVYCDDDIRLCRRGNQLKNNLNNFMIVKRDSTERGRQIEGILYQYHRFVRPAHLEFVQPVENKNHINYNSALILFLNSR